jgi:hypothetical protein
MKKTRKSSANKQEAQSKATAEDIAMAAYYRWEQRGRPHGDDMQDWLEAEQQFEVTREQEETAG